jgi:hypothetical protein
MSTLLCVSAPLREIFFSSLPTFHFSLSFATSA